MTPTSAKDIAKLMDAIAELERAKKKDYEAISDSYLALAMAQKDLQDWNSSIEASEDSIKWAKKINDKFVKSFKISKATEEIGSTYEAIEEFSKAITYYNDAIDTLEKSIEGLIKERKKISEEDFLKYSTLTRSLYVNYLKRKIDVYLKTQDEKKAKETIQKPWQKYLKKKDPDYLEILTFLADINIHFAAHQKVKNLDLLIYAIGELVILEFFAKKYSEDQKYWSNKMHRDLREKSKILVETLRIPLDEQILGKEMLNILKQEQLETKDHMYIDKILKIRSEDVAKKNEELMNIIDAIKKDEAAFIVLSMAQNELIMSLAEENKYNEAFEKAKDVMKIIKKIKNKLVKNFMLGETQLTIFRVNAKRQDWKQAEKEVKKAIDYFEENIHTMCHACFATLELASLYITQKNLNKAESTLEKPIERCAELGSPELLARLFELLGGIKLKNEKIDEAAVHFGASAFFYLIANDQDKYREFLTLGIHLYGKFLESIGFEAVQFT